MFNWDNPLAPPEPRVPDVTPDLAIVGTAAAAAAEPEPTATADLNNTQQAAAEAVPPTATSPIHISRARPIARCRHSASH
mgnify:CR=1 FL=1